MTLTCTPLLTRYFDQPSPLFPGASQCACTHLAGGAIIFYTWGENYGDQASSASVSEQFSKAWSAISRDRRVALLGAMQSLFEASMYSFVFLWTPALSSGGEKLPHGFIFACFMAASMLGSGLTGAWLMKRYRVEAYMKAVFAAASATLALPCLLLLSAPAGGAGSKVAGQPAGGISGRGQLMMLCFCAFEVLVGVFWPSMMTMRAVYVPEDLRATIMNCFRIPLNLFVCVILYNVSAFPLAAMFGLCAVFLGLAAMLQVQLEAAIKGGPPGAGLPLSDERPADEGEGLVTKK